MMQRFKQIEEIFPAVKRMQKQIRQCDIDLKSWQTAFSELVNLQQLDTFKDIMEKNLLAISDQVLKDSETQIKIISSRYEEKFKVLEK